jgi:hypothetical protein
MNAGGFFVFAVCALIIFVPIALIGFLTWRIKSGFRRGIFLFAIVVIPLVALYFDGFIGSSAARLTHDHSFRVPASVTNIRCDDFLSMTSFMDSGASAHFEMARADLPALWSQFKISSTNAESDSTPAMPPPGFGKLIKGVSGKSRDGNVMHLDIYDINPERVGVYIVTIWN